MTYGSTSLHLGRRPRGAPVALPDLGAWSGRVASHALFDVDLEPDGNLILVRTRGVWTVDEVDVYFDIMRKWVSASRIRFGRARVLADVTAAPIQAPAVAMRFAAGNELFAGADDKLALVTGSSLEKIQIRPQLPGDRTQVFVSQSAALTWINAYP